MLLRPILILALVASAGCATGTTALWRAGVRLADPEVSQNVTPTPAEAVDVYLRDRFGPLEETQGRRWYLGATTTVLRKAFRIPDALQGEDPRGEPERGYTVLGWVTTEEFPRDPEGSKIYTDTFSNAFGVGTDPWDLFTVAIDPAFYADARRRLQTLAGQIVGADAVIGVFATGEAEHQMWEGVSLGLNTRSTRSALFVDGQLHEFRLRDVRLHGIAVRYD